MPNNPVGSVSPGRGNLLARGRPAVWTVLFVAALLSVHLVLSFQGVVGRSVTADETAHLTAGYTYWKFNDYRLQPENGNLPQRWGALPVLLAQPELNPQSNPDDWRFSRVWDIAQSFLFESGNNTDFILLCARTGMLFWSLAGGLLVYAWARKVWGAPAGLAALALFSFSPTTLAHGALVTSDMCAAVCMLAALFAWHRMCLRPTFAAALLTGAVSGLALVAKFSSVLLIPAFAIIGMLSVAFAAEGNRGRHAARIAAAFAAATMIAGAVVWAFFGFRYRAFDPLVSEFSRFYLPWETVVSKGGVWTKAVDLARQCHLLPEAFLYGFSFVAYFSTERGAFVAGQYGSTGWWWFFPFAFLVKSTIGELATTSMLSITGLSAVQRIRQLDRRKLARSSLMPLAVFSLVFIIVSLTSHLNIGQRHILPIYLILFIFAGALFSNASKLLRSLGVGAVLLGAAEMLANHPNHLAFFNRLAGGPENGWRLLVDSSLDWGQDVSGLGQWVQTNRRPNDAVYVSTFGTADPEYEGIRGEILSPYYSLGKPRAWFELRPGLYCLSATMLQDVYGIRPGPWTMELEKDFQQLKAVAKINLANRTWDRTIPEIGFHPEHPLWLLDRLRFARLCQYLKVKQPEALINHTQFVFRLSNEELETFTNKPYSALADLMECEAAKP